MLNFLTSFKKAIIDSFNKSNQGKETVNNLIWKWGIPSYIFIFLVLEKIVRIKGLFFLDIIVVAKVFCFYIWHIYAIHKCKPPKTKLTKEEKRLLKEKKKREFRKRFINKLLLQESLSEWNPVTIITVFDIFCIAHFLSYVI